MLREIQERKENGLKSSMICVCAYAEVIGGDTLQVHGWAPKRPLTLRSTPTAQFT